MSNEGPSVALAMATFAAYLQQTSVVVEALWVQLHTGHPGKDGTDNIAGNTVRVNASTCFGTDPVDNMDGTISGSNDAAIGPWLAVSTSETYTHVSFWDDETVGAFQFSGQITAAAVTAGDNWSVPIGDCTATWTVAA